MKELKQTPVSAFERRRMTTELTVSVCGPLIQNLDSRNTKKKDSKRTLSGDARARTEIQRGPVDAVLQMES